MLITISELQNYYDGERILELAMDPGMTEEQQANVLNTIIAAADSEVKAMLSKQYSVEQIEANPHMKYCCAIIALWKLEHRRPGSIPASIETDYQAVHAALVRLQTGDDLLHEVPQLLPRQIPAASKVYEQSDYFVGMPVHTED